MASKAETSVENLVMPVIEDMGFEYVGTEIKKVGADKELIIYADTQGGLSLDDCEQISKVIDPMIEELDPIKDGYYLCVSSPGLDRPLKNERDFKRSLGKTVDVKLYKAINKQKSFTGELISYSDEGFIIKNGEEQKDFLYKDTAIVRLHVDI